MIKLGQENDTQLHVGIPGPEERGIQEEYKKINTLQNKYINL